MDGRALNRWVIVLVMSTVPYPHIEIAADRVPVIQGTTTKVVEIALDHLAHHWDSEEIHRQHPHLSLAQIHAALAYYYDHQSELDHDIGDRLERSQEIKQSIGESVLKSKLQNRDKPT